MLYELGFRLDWSSCRPSRKHLARGFPSWCRAKAILRTRPIYHSSDAAIRGHVFCSFLALMMQKELPICAAATAW